MFGRCLSSCDCRRPERARWLRSESDPSATDLLVVGTSQRKGLRRLWLGSTSELALRRARVPVVCAPVVSPKVLDETARQEIGKDEADDVC